MSSDPLLAVEDAATRIQEDGESDEQQQR